MKLCYVICKKFIPKTEYLKVYHVLFLSHVGYCITVWSNIPSYRLEKVCSLQKKVLSLVVWNPLYT